MSPRAKNMRVVIAVEMTCSADGLGCERVLDVKIEISGVAPETPPIAQGQTAAVSPREARWDAARRQDGTLGASGREDD
jgi:hypothetical protein